MIFRTLNEAELKQWAQHCASVFSGPDDTPAYFSNHYLLDPTHDPNGVFLAVDGDVIASTLRVFRREIYVRGRRITMGGIGEVSTKPEYRKQGLSGKLLEMAVAYMEREGLQTSLLFTGVNGHYSRYGWFTAPTRFVTVDAKDAPELPEGDVIRSMEDRDLPSIKALCEAHHAQYTGPVVRDEDTYWSGWMTFAWSAPHVIERQGRIVAYVDATWSAQSHRMKDFARTQDGPDVATALAAHARAMGWDVAKLSIPAADRPGQNGPFTEDLGSMVRLNVPFEFDGQRIDDSSKLLALLSGLTFFGADSF